ncbi:MAG: hypothetical protein GC186_11365 [Rhodobacteraceae bacterium]|nr:hypothetical protein [Paracoccaceae bacterium]
MCETLAVDGMIRFRYAAWAASRAVRGFKSKVGLKVLKTCPGLVAVAGSIDKLPHPDDFDKQHADWRSTIIGESRESGAEVTAGVAAKLINVYLKTLCLALWSDDNPINTELKSKLGRVHPPVDRILLTKLRDSESNNDRRNDWTRLRDLGWTRFTDAQYEDAIKLIDARLAVDGDSGKRWRIEKHWSPGNDE